MPTQPYILFDSARNHLYIKWVDQVMVDALASTGSGTILVLSHTEGNPWQWTTQRGRAWWCRLTSWGITLLTRDKRPSSPSLYLTISLDHAQPLS